MRGTRYDPRPPPPSSSDRLLLLLVVAALVLAAGVVYVRVVAALLDRLAVALS